MYQKQKSPPCEDLCGSSKVLGDRQDFVACFTLRSLPGPQRTLVMLGRTLGGPVSQRLLFTASFRPKGRIHRTRRMTALIHKRCHRQKPMNTNSHYSENRIACWRKDCPRGWRIFGKFHTVKQLPKQTATRCTIFCKPLQNYPCFILCKGLHGTHILLQGIGVI